MLRDLPPTRSQPDIEIFMTTPGTDDEPNPPSNTYVDPLDDVFGSAPSSPSLHAQRENDDFPDGSTATFRQIDHFSDVSRLRSIHVTNGYREGIAASKEKHIQEGFDEGYGLGAETALKAGWIIGALEGLHRALANHKPREKTSATGELDDCLRDVAVAREEANKELSMEKLFSKQYFGEDGVWSYHIPGQEDEGEVTFAKVAEAHPIISAWAKRLDELCGKLGVVLA